MAFVKVVKTNAYFKRFQTKPRRRREAKTDYAQRRALVTQDKNKYNTPKYRLVVRTTNTKVICQIIYATIEGDRVVASAESTELTRYGIPVGLKNYSAAYCTGLLVARRLLKSLNLDSQFVGQTEVNGEEFHIADEETERRPFRCILDVGLVRTTIGARVFGAMKGAADGGLDIPHNTKRFPGYCPPEERKGKKEGEYDAETHMDRIMGTHVSEYMTSMQENEPEEYEKHFSQYIKHGISADDVEEMYEKAHAAIRADPERKPKENKDIKNERRGNRIVNSNGTKYVRHQKLSLKERKNRVMRKIAKAQMQHMADEEEEE